ncbi:MAG TPA: DNA-binding protein [Peptococcaceae bacterium]|nr:MAG: Putative nucleic acid-binding protein, contains PIN domain [Moorella sp. 60_41]HBT46493.1 DNA-binding protein [Peptococcaceae bacterium]
MDRVFLDANVLFSAAYGSSSLLRFWELARSGKIKLLTSGYALEEARRNLDNQDQRRRLEDLAKELTLVPEPPPGVLCPVSLPEKDRPLLAAALCARATHFVTGDKRHFEKYFGLKIQDILICTPRQYFEVQSGACRDN